MADPALAKQTFDRMVEYDELMERGPSPVFVGRQRVGGSWEGFVIETIVGALPRRASWGYYRTAGGAEIDLVVDMGASEIWAIEIKRSTAPSVSKGFHSACEDLKPKRKLVVHAGDENFPIARDIEAIPLSRIPALV